MRLGPCPLSVRTRDLTASQRPGVGPARQRDLDSGPKLPLCDFESPCLGPRIPPRAAGHGAPPSLPAGRRGRLRAHVGARPPPPIASAGPGLDTRPLRSSELPILPPGGPRERRVPRSKAPAVWFVRQPQAPLGWAVPPPWHRPQRVLTVRGWVSCRGDGTWGCGDVTGCGPGWLARGSCHWPMGVGRGHRAGAAVSWRLLPGPAGARSALAEQRGAAWPPASRRLPPTTAVATRSSSNLPRAGDSGPLGGSGPCGGLGVGLKVAETPSGGGCTCSWPGYWEAARCVPAAHSSGLGLWVSCPGTLTHSALGLTLGDVLGDVGGWPSACVRPVPEPVPGPAMGGQRCWRGTPPSLGVL